MLNSVCTTFLSLLGYSKNIDEDTVGLALDMETCSLAMGVSPNTIASDRANITTAARRASTFLQAVRSIVPQEFSTEYKNPCWFSNLKITKQIRAYLMLTLNSEERNMLSKKQVISIANKLFDTSGQSGTLLCMPFFFVAGFPKSGTSTLDMALRRLPELTGPVLKEPHWWTRIPLSDLSPDYLQLVVMRYLLNFFDQSKYNYHSITYDASQSTLWDSNFFINDQDYCTMPAIISRVLPDAKFIVLMRNPTNRLYSMFLYSCSSNWGRDIDKWPEAVHNSPAETFHKQIIEDLDYFNDCLQKNNRSLFECINENRFRGERCGGAGYRITVSLYYIHLLKWLKFYPKEQFLFLKTEDMAVNPYETMSNITHFLGSSPVQLSQAAQWMSRKINTQSLHPTTELKMWNATRTILEEFYRPYNAMLAGLLDDRRFLWDD